MRKILFIAPEPFFEIRGTPIAIKDILNILSDKYEIDFISYPFGTDLEIKNVNHTRCFGFGFNSIKIGPSFKKIILDFGLSLSVLRKIIINKYFAVHTVEEAGLFGVFIKKVIGRKFVYDMDSIMSEQINRSKFSKLTFVMNFIEGSMIKNSDMVLAISPNFKSYCEEINKNCNFVEIFDIPQIEKSELPNNLRKSFYLNKKKVLYIGNGEKYQGVHLIEETAKIMPELQFFIVGTGREEIIDNITYISKVDMNYVWGIMQLSDILISPRLEGTNTPMKVYTYMSSGKPIVATDIPAHNILRNCSFIVKKDKDSIINGLKLALTNEGKVKAKKAREIVQKEFSFIKLKEIVLRGYKELER